MSTKRRSNLDAILKLRVKWLNELLGTPLEPYTTTSPVGEGMGGSMRHNPGNIHVDGNIGGYRLEQICEGGGSRPVGGGERFSKSTLIDVVDVAIFVAEQATKQRAGIPANLQEAVKDSWQQ